MLTDWERHGAQVPLTRTIIETAPPTHVGTIFTARTGVSRITFDDRMEVVVWRPHGGFAGIGPAREARPVGDGLGGDRDPPLAAGGSEIHWREELRLRGLPAPWTRWSRPRAGSSSAGPSPDCCGPEGTG